MTKSAYTTGTALLALLIGLADGVQAADISNPRGFAYAVDKDFVASITSPRVPKAIKTLNPRQSDKPSNGASASQRLIQPVQPALPIPRAQGGTPADGPSIAAELGQLAEMAEREMAGYTHTVSSGKAQVQAPTNPSQAPN